MKKLKYFIITQLFFLALPFFAFADISVSLKLNRYEVGITDSIKMTVSISGSRDTDTPQIKGIENFIVQNTGRSSQVQIINGRVNSSLDFTYYIQPKGLGTFDIGPASVKVDGKTYQSSPVKLTVKNSVDQKTGDNSRIFLTATLSAKTVYLEEQVQYTVRLYHLAEVSNVSLNMPEADGIEFKQTGKPVEYSTVYNSRNYQVVEVKYSLTPSKPGRININPARMNMVVRAQQKEDDDNDVFSMDDFFASVRGKPVTLATSPVTLDVLPVPEAGKPADYAGLTGVYRITSELVPGRVKAGESATLTVTVRGSGNVNRIPDLKMPDIKDAKVYADEPKLEIQQSERGIEGIKTMKWAIVPGKQGQYNVPSLSISYFDTANRYYNRISTKPFVLFADPGTGVIAQSPFSKNKMEKSEKEEVEELGKDILPIHRSVKDIFKTSSNIGWMSWIILLLPALICGSLYSASRISAKNSRMLRSFLSAKNFFKICEDKDLNANNLSKAILDYFNKRFSLEAGSISPAEASEILRKNGCKEESVNQMEWILKKIETLIYTGKGEEPCDLAIEASLIIKSIEKEIK